MRKNIYDLLKIDKRSKNSSKEQLLHLFRENILNFLLEPNESLPSPKKVSDTLEISGPVVEEVYAILVKEHYFYLKQGLYYIHDFQLHHSHIQLNYSMKQSIEAIGLKPSIELIFKRYITKSDQDLKDKPIHWEGDILHLRRRFYGNDIPISIVDTYIPLMIFKDIENYILDLHPTFPIYHNIYKRPIMHTQRMLKVHYVSHEMAMLLNQSIKMPSMAAHTYAYDIYQELIEYSISHFSSRYYILTSKKISEIK